MRKVISFAALSGLLLIGGCANWVLPSESQSKSRGFETYEQAQTTYNRVQPFRTTAGELADMGIFPGKTSNLQVVTYLDVMQRFMPQQTVKVSDLDPAVQACINAREGCEGWVLPLERTDRQRVGNVSLDVLGFRKETLSEGWNAEMVLLLTDDVVVYKLWSGAPNVTETKSETKPLGPLQDLGPAAASAVKSAIGQ